MLVGKELCVTKNGRTIMAVPEITAKSGEISALVGPSGSGKTTLLNCLGLLEPLSMGRLTVDEIEYSRPSEGKRRKFWKEKASFIFQDYGLIDEWTIAQNVTLRESRRPLPKKVAANVARVLSDVGLHGREQERAATLSGGEKQRLGVARALFKNAAYVFADEPTASLDAENREIVVDLLREAAKRGACVVVATHDEEMMLRSDSVYQIWKPGSETDPHVANHALG